MIVVNSKPAAKWRDRERLCYAKLMISHSAPFAATALLGMSLLAGATLGPDVQPNSGDPDSALREGMVSRKVGFLRCQLVASPER